MDSRTAQSRQPQEWYHMRHYSQRLPSAKSVQFYLMPRGSNARARQVFWTASGSPVIDLLLVSILIISKFFAVVQI